MIFSMAIQNIFLNYFRNIKHTKPSKNIIGEFPFFFQMLKIVLCTQEFNCDCSLLNLIGACKADKRGNKKLYL